MSKTASEIAGALTLVALGLLAAVLLGFAPPDWPLVVPLANLRPLIALALLPLALCFLPLRRWIRAGLFLAGAVLAFVQIILTTQGLAAVDDPATSQAATLRIVSFNLLSTNTGNGAAIADFLESANADVAFIQEARPLQPYLADIEKLMPYRVGCDDRRNCDLMLLSRHKLTNVKIGQLSELSPNRFYRADITIGGQQVAIVAPHLTKPYYENFQLHEFEHLAGELHKITGPVIMAGDFNSAPWAPGFVNMAEASDLRTGPHEPGTWPVPAAQWGIPIDHVLARAPAHIEEVHALPDNFGSNHRGLLAIIRLGPPGAENPA